MQTSNNYDKLVWNGDMGIVTYVDAEEAELGKFPDPEGDRSVKYAQQELDQLELAFCISIHKSQGSEYQGGHAHHDLALHDAEAKPRLYGHNKG